ncbi:hypothetical protein [Streptomyces sp. NPDC026673]|uniref:hypothetical protein n=1 Tax=Streptomyces sp. NPDC026673 TaxID=3155724 RepID=UPI0033CA069A
MSEEKAVVLAALIGAAAAILVGGLAFAAAVRQVTKSAEIQRDQAFWQAQRDSYTQFITAAHECVRMLRHFESISEVEWEEIAKWHEKLSLSYSALLLAVLDPEIRQNAHTVKNIFDRMKRLLDERRTPGYVPSREVLETIRREKDMVVNAIGELRLAMLRDLHRAAVTPPRRRPPVPSSPRM